MCCGIMSGYKMLLRLYSQAEVWREVKIRDDITFEQLHIVIQKLFGFSDYHNYEFQIPHNDPDDDLVNLGNLKGTIGYDECEDIIISEILEDNPILLYVYDFGDNWEIIVHKLEDVADYKNKTALITDYKGKYNPIDDMGGLFVFEEILEAVDDGDVEIVLDDYGLRKSDLTKMDFEKKYEIGSRIRCVREMKRGYYLSV